MKTTLRCVRCAGRLFLEQIMGEEPELVCGNCSRRLHLENGKWVGPPLPAITGLKPKTIIPCPHPGCEEKHWGKDGLASHIRLAHGDVKTVRGEGIQLLPTDKTTIESWGMRRREK